MMYTDGAQCTANFVFTDGAGTTYVGYAAHCAGPGAATDTNGCDAAVAAARHQGDFNEGGALVSEGTQVGAGTLVYCSWLTMQQLGTTDANTCAYNDLALVKVDAADVAKVNPSIPFWGGPTGIDTDGTAAGDRVYSYGNSSLRGGIEPLSPKQGASLGDDGERLVAPGLHRDPGHPGRLRQRVPDADGNALGVLSTLALAPLPGSNSVGDLAQELAFAQAHSGISGLQLVPGTEPFSPSSEPAPTHRRPRPARSRTGSAALYVQTASLSDRRSRHAPPARPARHPR